MKVWLNSSCCTRRNKVQALGGHPLHFKLNNCKNKKIWFNFKKSNFIHFSKKRNLRLEARSWVPQEPWAISQTYRCHAYILS